MIVIMKKLIYVLLVAAMPFLCFAQNNLSPQQIDVMMKMASLKSALLNKDSVALSALLSADVTYGHTNGLVQTKAQLIRSVVSREQDYKVIDPLDMKIRVYDNTGIVNMKSKVKMIYNGAPLDLSMHIVLVWIKKDNEWKLVARQSVKM
jgi:hypothetical protein